MTFVGTRLVSRNCASKFPINLSFLLWCSLVGNEQCGLFKQTWWWSGISGVAQVARFEVPGSGKIIRIDGMLWIGVFVSELHNVPVPGLVTFHCY
jgi:hypothetical protein